MKTTNQKTLEVGHVPSVGAHIALERLRPFLRYFSTLVSKEICNDIRFLTEPDKNA